MPIARSAHWHGVSVISTGPLTLPLSGVAAAASAGAVSVPAAELAFGPSLDFFALPSLTDEAATYAGLGWTELGGARAFDFIDIGAVTTTDVHDDSEADDLWTWDAQQRRGYTDAIVNTYRGQWLTYFQSGLYRADLIADNAGRGDITPATSADPFCHGYGVGLITHGYLNNASASITEAEAIADIGLLNLFGSTTSPGASGTVGGRTVTALSSSGHNMGVGGGRQMARIGQLIANLAYATGKKKWMDWLTAITDAYMGAANWAESPSLGIVQGGAYFCDRNWMAVNGQQGTAAWDAGARSNSIYQYGMHAEFLWRSWLVNKRADVRARLIAFARFMQQYAHNPANTGSGGPFCSSYFGITPGGGYWHRDIPGGAHYDGSIINILAWGYKLTGDAALLTRAKVHLRQATRWREGEPGAGVNPAPLCTATQVYDFLDTRRNTGGSRFFIDNKGQLQYAYQLFENGGTPSTLGDPTWTSGQANNAWVAIPGTTITGLPTVNPYSLDTNALVGRWNGYAFDDVNLRYYSLANGGHNDYAGNQIFRCSLGASPGWTEPKASTAAGSIPVNGSNASAATYSDGRPVSAHSYYGHQFIRKAGKAFLFGRGAIWNNGGVTNNVFAYTEGATDWDNTSGNFQIWGSLTGTQNESVRTVCKHPTTEDVYYNSESTLYRWRIAYPFTSADVTNTSLGSTPTNFNYWCSAVDSKRNRVVWWRGSAADAFGGVASTTVHIYTIDTGVWTTSTLTGASAGSITNSSAGVYQACDYCPTTDKFYVMLRGTTGGTVYEINANTFVVATLATTGGGSMTADTHGPCNRMRYAQLPSGKGGLFFHPNYTSPVWFLCLHGGGGGAAPTSFSTTFAAAENPISESGKWDRSATNFKAVRTTGGVAYAAAFTDGNLDAYARLVPSAFTAPSDNYEVTCTVIRNSFGVASSETEILLRLTSDGSTMNCYEVLYNNGGGELVQINGGGPGGFVEIGSTVFTFNAAEGTGDKIRARVTGTNPVVITAWAAPASNPTNWTQLFTYSDSSAQRKQTGQPGMGFYTLSADNNLLNCGWQDFSVVAI